MKRVPLLMMRTRGLIAPLVVNGNKPGTVKQHKGIHVTGPFRVYKLNNP